MKLTCVTAVFNAIKSGNRENLIRCVRSVAALKTEHEHLIYDGGSTDGTAELLRELERCGKMPHLRVVSEPDTGIYNALNKGVRDARGEWFYVLGCDDYICNPIVMDELMALVEPKVSVIATRVEREVHPEWFMQSLKDLSRIFFSPPVCHQGEIMRTALVRELGGFDERYKIAADADMLFKAHLRGERFLYVMKSFASFGCGGTSETTMQLSFDEFFDSMKENLKLSPAERDALQNRYLLPIRKILRFSVHRDLALRMGARQIVKIQLVRMPIVRTILSLVRVK